MTVWAMSGEASLNLSTIGGITTIGFNCTLGKPGAPHFLPPSTPSHPSSSPSRKPRHRGPAEKERNRLRAARHQAAQTAGNASLDPNKSSPLEASESTTFPTPVPVQWGQYWPCWTNRFRENVWKCTNLFGIQLWTMLLQKFHWKGVKAAH